jgi:hypothetical protein
VKCERPNDLSALYLTTKGQEYGPYCMDCFMLRSEENLQGKLPPKEEKRLAELKKWRMVSSKVLW